MAPFELFPRPAFFAEPGAESLPLHFATPADLVRDGLDPAALQWARAAGFSAESGELLLLPGAEGGLAGALFGLGSTPEDSPFAAGVLARRLPRGVWHVASGPQRPRENALGFGLGSYVFDRFRKSPPRGALLQLAGEVDATAVERQLAGVFLARDLVNLPASHMGPAALEDALRRLASHYDADVAVTVGEDLLEKGFPLIHAVGRAGSEAPRLLDMRWGRPGAPKVSLVGKGVCFDTGGLDIKPASSMLLMKKDMGGAANVMGLALMIMDAGLDVDLRVLVPAVENSISGNAFRPGDVLTSRKGLTIQIDNTDAEGRLVLADALTLADADHPDLLIDMATLTGAARVALGPDVPPFYTRDDALSGAIATAAGEEHDPLWRMPLYKPYASDLRTQIADITNAPSGGLAGSITAALFLAHFVEPETAWAHFDIYAWCPKEKPHAPAGGEAQGIRALYRVVRERFG